MSLLYFCVIPISAIKCDKQRSRRIKEIYWFLSIRLKSFARQHSSSAVCGPDRLESSSKFREISVCVTTYNRKAVWLHISLRSCFSGHFMSVSRAVTISPLVSIFAKDGRRYICARLLSIEAIDCQISCFASDHRKLALSSHGTDLLYLYQLVPHWFWYPTWSSTLHRYRRLSSFFFPSLLTLGLYRANLGYYYHIEK